MTTVQEVTVALSELIENELDGYPKLIEKAEQWISNDIIKMKISQGYDDWINDLWDHGCFVSLKERIIYYLENAEYINELL